MDPSLVERAVPRFRAFSRELAREGDLLSPDYLGSGLTLASARCVFEIGATSGISLTALARSLRLDLGYVSRVVARLEQRSLVRKRSDAADGRSIALALSPRGEKLLAELGARADAKLREWLSTKPAAMLSTMVTALEAGASASARAFSIREAKSGDVGQVIARHGRLYVEQLGYPERFEHYVVEAFAEFFRVPDASRDRVFVAEHLGTFLGSVAMKGRPKKTSQLRFLLVEPEARGRGIGRALVEHAIDHARRAGDRRVVLDTASDLAAARRLYERAGFRRIASEPAPHLRRGVASERWELRLTSRPGKA